MFCFDPPAVQEGARVFVNICLRATFSPQTVEANADTKAEYTPPLIDTQTHRHKGTVSALSVTLAFCLLLACYMDECLVHMGF